MTKRAFFCISFLLVTLCPLAGQNIKGHYVSRMEEGGTIYHTFPKTLFESKENGDLTFDITYKEGRDGFAVVNFTYTMQQATPADSVRINSGRTVMRGPVEKIYIEPEKKVWKHRYSFSADITSLYTFFDEEALPEIVIYAAEQPYVYRVKRGAWRSYAPVGYKIFEMIRYNERH